MSILDAAFEWVKSRTGTSGSMPTIEDCYPFGTGGGEQPVPEEEKPKRSITKEEAESLLVKCEYCGISQFIEEGHCKECGSALPEPVVPEVIEKYVSVPTPTHYSSIPVELTTGCYTMCSTGMMTSVPK